MPFRVLRTLHLLSATGAKHVHGHRQILMTNPARTLGGLRQDTSRASFQPYPGD
jgi:hypothetical protein